MTDTVHIHDLKVWASIGVYDWEHDFLRPLVLNVALRTDFSTASTTDDVQSALDYGALSEKIAEFSRARHFHLLETFAEEMATMLLSSFSAESVSLQVDKPGAIANASAAGVSIERNRAL